MLKDVASKNGDARRNAGGSGSSVHGARGEPTTGVCGVAGRSVELRYRSIRPDDGNLRDAMKKIAGERRRIGYRRIHLLLERQGIVMN